MTYNSMARDDQGHSKGSAKVMADRLVVPGGPCAKGGKAGIVVICEKMGHESRQTEDELVRQ